MRTRKQSPWFVNVWHTTATVSHEDVIDFDHADAWSGLIADSLETITENFILYLILKTSYIPHLIILFQAIEASESEMEKEASETEMEKNEEMLKDEETEEDDSSKKEEKAHNAKKDDEPDKEEEEYESEEPVVVDEDIVEIL